MATGLEKVSVHSNPKEGNAKEFLNYYQFTLVSHASKVMLRILQMGLQQYVGRRTGDHIGSICWIIEKTREFLKDIYFCFIDYPKTFDCVDHNKVWEILQDD